MARPKNTDPKVQALRGSNTLNPRPKDVHDPLFQEGNFFDPRDVAQVKYEMIRRVEKEDVHVSQAATAFGFSRPSFYKAQEDFAREGFAGLIPRKRGPKKRRKLSAEVMEFVTQSRLADPSLDIASLLKRIHEKFAVSVHRRSLERALLAVKKKPSIPSVQGAK